ncbi:MAG TPA: MG2 domain-containing protein [Ramlibacter sp.]|uniref:alpha-2-macroglobulin family protein n=1 Tax=Ramlibacter sp. TaxID=1917967 RepID=UPI002CD5433B|nr:MG2 domain-containing protein [Ramlibacter sp.]HVZ45879.1 MG2 domain-containing protein [Ramlibacter sp.]
MIGAHAARIVSVSPQGEVSRVRQVVAKFDNAVLAFGDPKAPAPLQITCSDAQATAGNGRWTSEREWVFDFREDLPPGIACTLRTREAFKPIKGELTAGEWRFNTGGPYVRWARPAGDRIDEEQQFLFVLNGDATLASVREGIGCVVEGIGERVPVRLVQGRERDEMLEALRVDKAAAKTPLRYLTFACNRRLPADAKVQIVYGKGVRTPSGIANAVEKRFEYRVREPFAIAFGCERENAQSPCLPIRPVTLTFNAPVPRKYAEQIRLKTARGTIAPKLDAGATDAESVVDSVTFPGPLAERAEMAVELPRDFRDASGRALRNADAFPLKFTTAAMPPLAKFAAAPFGIVERYAEPDSGPLLPVTLRRVEQALRVQGAAPSKVGDLQPKADADIVRWLLKVQQYHESWVDRAQAKADSRVPLPPVVDPQEPDRVEARAVSLLDGQPGTRVLQLPRAEGDDPRPFEVVGIPLQPGFHVVEIASPLLAQSLLDPRYGARRKMYVRTTALVTNLGVHFKLGRENAIAWVTTLDKGTVVPNARVRVSTCNGTEVASGVTNAQGIAEFKAIAPQPPRCGGSDDDGGRAAYFVSARTKDAHSGEDLAFTFSDWYRGIDPWRFNVPVSREAQPDRRFHSILDRTLVRAGETVSMKHIARVETSRGLGLPPDPPGELVVTHVGSGQQFTQPLAWRKTPTGGLSAESRFQVPPAAKLGVYSVTLGGPESRSFQTVEFRVEEFRLPVFEGRVAPAQKGALVDAQRVAAGVEVHYVSGGAAANLPVRVSALVRTKAIRFADYDEFGFDPPRQRREEGAADDEDAQSADDSRIVADKLPVTLDRNGTGQVTIEPIPKSPRARELVLEASYADPNGEVQTLRSVNALWPAAVVAGIRAENWVSVGRKIRFQAIALGLDGKPQAGVPVAVKATARVTTTSRKRMVGGFYTYDNRTSTRDLGAVCDGKSDARGLVLCEASFDDAGEIELVASATDAQGHASQAATSVWVTKQGELWFGGDNTDRIDVLPEKKSYQPGETAKFQVRMPFRYATALVTVEREGIIASHVVQLRGDDPTVQLRIEEGWGPNVYVSVLALRGRLREVPWYSFFTWGYKVPREWWHAFWFEGREYVAPTALVDLSKPAYRLGLAEVRVGTKGYELGVSVKADKEAYPVRGHARVSIQVTQPGGQPAANAEVALAAVDQALLELMPNDTWNLLEAMLQRRSWGVETSTAQMEIIGRRHYGRKAAPAGGGGGKSPQRELLDTLLVWNPRVQLDAQGRATVDVPLNDALTTFRIVAVADMGTGLFGTGRTTIRSTQDLQIISGLPPLVREGDQFAAQLTLRNTTARAMRVEVAPRATLITLPPQTIDIPASEARTLEWNVTAPASLAFTRTEAILWEVEARDTLGGARDALKISQRIVPAVPLTVQQATLVQLDKPYTLDVAPPVGAIAGRGGIRLALQPKLAEGLDGVRDWFAAYPFICLEQKASKSVGLRDAAMWQAVVAQLPSYLDRDGLASYFPPRDGEADHGSDILTAYVLAATHEAASLDPAFALPDDVRAPMERGLTAFVEGRIQRNFWAPRKDLDVRKLAAIEALSRYGKAPARLLASITIAPNQWPTSAVIDWLDILKRVPDIPQRDQRLAEAAQVLRARLSYQGTKLVFSTERDDFWWWLMANGDVNTARLILAVLDDPAWSDDMGRLANGFIARQRRGAWLTTTANLWGGLTLEKFSRKFESAAVTGATRASLGASSAAVDWSRVERVGAAGSGAASGGLPQTRVFGAPASPGNLRNNTVLLPWPQDAGAKQETRALSIAQQGTGKPWLTVQSVAAVPLAAPFFAGYEVKKTIAPVEQAVAGRWSRGDVVRVTLEVNASADMTWVVVSDPVPGGATLLGSGLGHDSQIATQGEKRAGSAWPAFEERSFEGFRGYYEYVPKGNLRVDYTMRLNNVGDFALPPTRVEAMYAPEMFGELPNVRVKVEPGR